MEALVRQHLPKERGLLDPSGCEIAPDLDWPSVDTAVAMSAAAPELIIGERPLAFFSLEKSWPERFHGYLLVTDRRVVGRYPRLNGTFVPVHLRYEWLQGVREKKGLLGSDLVVLHANQQHEIKLGIFNEQLKAFLEAVLALRPEERVPGPVPLCAPSEHDPTGAQHAHRSLVEDDPRTTFLLGYLAQAAASGVMPAGVAADLVARVVLQHRIDTCGRGVLDGSWMSPLGADDLSHVFVMTYGQPLAHQAQPMRSLTFDSRNKTDRFLDAVDSVSSAVGLAKDVVTLDVGSLVGAALGPKEVVTFSTMLRDAGAFSVFRLFGNQRPLSESSPFLAADVLVSLERREAAAILRRCVYGWSEPLPGLFERPSSEIIERFAAVVGPFDARVLGRPADQG